MCEDVYFSSNIWFPEHLKVYNTDIHIADFHIWHFQKENRDRLPQKFHSNGGGRKKRGDHFRDLLLDKSLLYQGFQPIRSSASAGRRKPCRDGPRRGPSVSPTGRPLRVLWGNAGNSMLSPPVPLLMIAKSRASDFRKVPLKYPLLGGTLWQNLMTQAFIN